MKNKYLNIVLTFTFFFMMFSSCSKNKNKLTIPEDKLIQIFFDIHAAENIVSRAAKEEKDSLSKLYTQQIFDIHKIDKKEFEKNLNILKRNPENFKKFYEKLDKYGTKTLEEFREKNNETMLK